MNVILFQNRFEALILAGVKDCTIRTPRRDDRPRAVEGETVSLRVWTGQPYRSKQREFAQRVVKFVIPVRIEIGGVNRTDTGQALDRRWTARRDGFRTWMDMRRWFKAAHGLPFDGVLIHWEIT